MNKFLKLAGLSALLTVALVACAPNVPNQGGGNNGPVGPDLPVVNMVVPHNVERGFTEADAARTVELLYKSLFTINGDAMNRELEAKIIEYGVKQEDGDEAYTQLLNILSTEIVPAPFTYIIVEAEEDSTPVLDFLFWGTLLSSNTQSVYDGKVDGNVDTIRVKPEDVTLDRDTMTATHSMDEVVLVDRNGEVLIALSNPLKDEQAYKGKLVYKDNKWFLLFDLTAGQSGG